MIQKTLEGKELIVGTVFKVLRVDGDRLLSFFDHEDWTLEYVPEKWAYAPHNSVIYCFNNLHDATAWGERKGDLFGHYELWEALGEKLVSRPLAVHGLAPNKYFSLWHNQHNLSDILGDINASRVKNTVGAWRIKLKCHIEDIEVLMEI